MIFINLISLILIFIFIGYKKFIVKIDDLYTLFIKKFLTIIINLSIGLLLVMIYCWKRMINRRINRMSVLNKSLLKKIIYFPCFFMTIVILYPQHLLINIIGMIVIYFSDGGFSPFIRDLERIIDNIYIH